MAVTVNIYHNFLVNLLTVKNIDWNTDTIKMQLHTSSHSPDYDLDDFHDDLDNEVANGNGYTTGGATLSGCTGTLVESTSAPDWQASTAYALGAIVAKVTDNGHIYRCIQAGTSAGSEPTWTTNPGEQQPTDGTVEWAECGTCYYMLDFTAPTWPSSTITARMGIIIDTTPGTSGTNPLIACIDFGEDVSTTNGTFTVTPDATYGLIQIPIL